jgi:hypothetical protein
MQSICTKCAYSYKHDNALLKVIMTELAKADLVRTLKDAPAPGTATENSVADTIKQLNQQGKHKQNRWMEGSNWQQMQQK